MCRFWMVVFHQLWRYWEYLPSCLAHERKTKSIYDLFLRRMYKPYSLFIRKVFISSKVSFLRRYFLEYNIMLFDIFVCFVFFYPNFPRKYYHIYHYILRMSAFLKCKKIILTYFHEIYFPSFRKNILSKYGETATIFLNTKNTYYAFEI